jgi:hypothetical protein
MPVLINCQLMYCNKVILSEGKCQYSSIFRLLVRLNVNLIVGYKIGYSFFTGLFCDLFLFALFFFFCLWDYFTYCHYKFVVFHFGMSQLFSRSKSDLRSETSKENNQLSGLKHSITFFFPPSSSSSSRSSSSTAISHNISSGGCEATTPVRNLSPRPEFPKPFFFPSSSSSSSDESTNSHLCSPPLSVFPKNTLPVNETNLIETKHQIQFFFPSSSSSSSDSSISAVSVAGGIDVEYLPQLPNNNLTSPRYQLKQVWSSNNNSTSNSNGTTPLHSNCVSASIKFTKKSNYLISPINCTKLTYSQVEDIAVSVVDSSPVVCRGTVAKGYQIMDDDEEYSFVEYPDSEVEGDVSLCNGSTGPAACESDVSVDLDSLNLNDIAKGIVDDASDPNISEAELSLILNSSVNTRAYDKSRGGVETRFFDTIKSFGGDSLKALVSFADDGFMKERVFYIKLHGERSEVKRFILNKCSVKIALKWRNNNKRKKKTTMENTYSVSIHVYSEHSSSILKKT